MTLSGTRFLCKDAAASQYWPSFCYLFSSFPPYAVPFASVHLLMPNRMRHTHTPDRFMCTFHNAIPDVPISIKAVNHECKICEIIDHRLLSCHTKQLARRSRSEFCVWRKVLVEWKSCVKPCRCFVRSEAFSFVYGTHPTCVYKFKLLVYAYACTPTTAPPAGLPLCFPHYTVTHTICTLVHTATGQCVGNQSFKLIPPRTIYNNIMRNGGHCGGRPCIECYNKVYVRVRVCGQGKRYTHKFPSISTQTQRNSCVYRYSVNCTQKI